MVLSDSKGTVIDVSAYTSATYRLVDTFEEPSGQVQFLYSSQTPGHRVFYGIAVAKAETARMTFYQDGMVERPTDFPRRYEGSFVEATGDLMNGAVSVVARAACKLHGKNLGAIQ